MKERRQILFLNGPGFFDQEDLLALVESRGDRVSRVSMYANDLRERFIEADIVFMRGPWTATPDEKLLARQIAARLEPGFEIFETKAKEAAAAKTPMPRIYGIGRGALVLLASRSMGFCDFDTLEWTPAFEDVGPWVEVKPSGGTAVLTSLVQGRALPRFQGGQFRKEVLPWLNRKSGPAQSDPVGLKLSDRLFASFTDILALGDRMQLLDFGYREYPPTLPVRGQVLNSLVEGAF